MTANGHPGQASPDRVGEASDWFARMRGPGAAVAQDEFEVWRSDPVNAQAYSEIAAIWSLAGSRDAGKATGVGATRAPRYRSALVAAAVVAAIAIGLLVANLARSPSRQEEVTYANHAERIRTIDLADGSRVMLNAGSKVAIAYSAHERLLRLTNGRARFAVAHDSARPFVVMAGDRAVVARGTLFDVSLSGQGVAVTLIEGSVDLERREGGERPRHLARLRPGEQASFASGVDLPRITGAGPDTWASDMLAGDGMLLSQILAEANRRGSIKIELADPALGTLQVSGGFPVEQPRALADALAAALDLRAVVRSDGAIVLEPTAQTTPAK